MSRVFDPVMKDLRENLLRMGSRSEAILDKSVRSLLELDGDLAAEVESDDLEIDRLDVRIDEAVLRTLALQAPVAGDLRKVVAVKMIANDLERVGDLARNIAKSAMRLAEGTPFLLPPILGELAGSAQNMLRRALDAFSDEDAQKARLVLDEDDQLDRVQDDVIRSALEEINANPELASTCVDVILVAKHLERVGDHATNIAEEVVLAAEATNLKHSGKLGTR